VEMKVKYPTNKKNTPKDFSGTFHNIKNSFKLTIPKKIIKNSPIFSVSRSQKNAGGRKIFPTIKN
jgi:hypothetical protein